MTSSVQLLILCALIAAAFVTSSDAVTCYYCSAMSGIPDSPCGNQFNGTAVRLMSKYSVTCSGVCVTQVTYTGSGDEVLRTCSTAHPSDGCRESDPSFTSGKTVWSCLATCTDDFCNNGSDGVVILPSFITILVTSAVLAVSRLLL
jgi:hypothetical protein